MATCAELPRIVAATAGAPAAALRDTKQVNAVTGTPAVIEPTTALPQQGTLIEKAMAFVSKQPESFGFDATGAPAQFIPDPVINRTTSGSAAVHLQQIHEGVPIFQMSRTVRFDTQGQIVDAIGDNAIVSPGFSALPRLDAASAVEAAASHIANTAGETRQDEFGQQHDVPTVDLTGFNPDLLSSVLTPARPAVFDKGPFENPIQASLVVFQQPQGSRLAWQITLTLLDYADQYLILVASDNTSQEILYSRSLMHSALARGTVMSSARVWPTGVRSTFRVLWPITPPYRSRRCLTFRAIGFSRTGRSETPPTRRSTTAPPLSWGC